MCFVVVFGLEEREKVDLSSVDALRRMVSDGADDLQDIVKEGSEVLRGVWIERLKTLKSFIYIANRKRSNSFKSIFLDDFELFVFFKRDMLSKRGMKKGTKSGGDGFVIGPQGVFFCDAVVFFADLGHFCVIFGGVELIGEGE